MKLISVEDSRVLSLVVIRMEEGQPYLPDLVDALVDRYSFLQSPGTMEEMQDEHSVFAMGKWRNTQIQELTAYSDGMIVRMRAVVSSVS